jgi:hypothetical protein
MGRAAAVSSQRLLQSEQPGFQQNQGFGFTSLYHILEYFVPKFLITLEALYYMLLQFPISDAEIEIISRVSLRHKRQNPEMNDSREGDCSLSKTFELESSR